MSTENPTPLCVGATGNLHGWVVTVAGRVVLGVELDGERYYWNEYNLVDTNGRSGTLVYEEGEQGPEWKLFQLLPPLHVSMTVAEAETKRVGDRVSFGGPAIPVTLVDRSRVYHIEGTPPDGVELGDLADFFNADAGDHMIVASWTGNEIEFYEGRDVPAETIATAFGLPHGAPAFQAKAGEGAFSSPPSTANRNGIIVLAALGLIGLVSTYSCLSSDRSPAPPADISSPSIPAPAPTLRLATGASGQLGSRNYTVREHTLVEVGRTAGRYQRREYVLTSGEQESALLVNGLTGGTRRWHLLQPVAPPPGFTPYDAAAHRHGSQLNLGTGMVTITELFFSQVREADGHGAPGNPSNGRQYGFLATGGGEWWIARWNDQRLSLHRGAPVEEKIVFAALGPGPEKPK